MKILKIKARAASAQTFYLLQKKGLIRTINPPVGVINCKKTQGSVRTIYSSNKKFGSHKLICVKCSASDIILNSHPDNEEFLLINNTAKKFNPLIIIIGLYKRRILQKKIDAGSLKEADFLALKLKYNDPLLSIFTMLKDTVHCELTYPGKGMPPIFFVTEPSNLMMDKLRLKKYQLSIK